MSLGRRICDPPSRACIAGTRRSSQRIRRSQSSPTDASDALDSKNAATARSHHGTAWRCVGARAGPPDSLRRSGGDCWRGPTGPTESASWAPGMAARQEPVGRFIQNVSDGTWKLLLGGTGWLLPDRHNTTAPGVARSLDKGSRSLVDGNLFTRTARPAALTPPGIQSRRYRLDAC